MSRTTAEISLGAFSCLYDNLVLSVSQCSEDDTDVDVDMDNTKRNVTITVVGKIFIL